MKKILLTIILVLSFVLYNYIDYLSIVSSSHDNLSSNQIETPRYQQKEIVYQNAGSSNDSAIISAFEQHLNNVQLEGSGIVTHILKDDLEGHRHQKFIVRVNSGQTLLIAHNIDLAPKVNNLSLGDTIIFFGEYVWNNKGGLIHWTHHDPSGQHITGWLKHNGQKYQ